MARKFRYYKRKLKENKTARKLLIFWQNMNKKAAAAALLGIAVLVFVYFAVTGSGKTDVQDDVFSDRQRIVIGIGSEHPSFGAVGENGEVTGFEAELACLLMERILPGKEVKLVGIESQEASYLLRNGKIDIAFAMLAPGTIKSEGLTLSRSYYEDEIAVLTTESRAKSGMRSIGGAKLYLVDMRKQTLSNMLSELEIKNVRIISCSSYPDGILAVTESSAYAIAAPRHKADIYLHSLFMLEHDSKETVSYCAAAWKDNKVLIELINGELKTSKDDIEALKDKWDL